MCENLAFLLAELSAEEIGQIGGKVFLIALLIAGLIKCLRIARRPTTNTLCVLSLAAFLFAVLLSAMTQPWIETLFASIISLVGRLLFLLSALILGIVGLVEYHRNQDQYNQGRKQAVWGILLSAIVIVILSRNLLIDLELSEVRIEPIANSSAEDFESDGSALHEKPKKKSLTNTSGNVETKWLRHLNFRYKAPNHNWVEINPQAVNPQACVAFIRGNPQIQFMILAERIGIENLTDPNALRSISQANALSVAPNAEFFNQRELVINNIPGICYDSRATISGRRVQYSTWLTCVNGYSYQLMALSAEKHSRSLLRCAEELFHGFHIIDPELVFHSPGIQVVEKFESPEFGYRVDLTHVPNWIFSLQPEEDQNLSDFVGQKTIDGSVVEFHVVPMELPRPDENPVILLNHLAVENFTFPNLLQALKNPQKITSHGMSGCEIQGTTHVSQIRYEYCFRLLKNTTHAYLVLGWWPQGLRQGKSAFEEVMEMFEVIPVSGSPKERMTKSQITLAALFYNQFGIDHFNKANFIQSVPYFQRSLEYQEDPVVLLNLAKAYSELGKIDAAIAELDRWPQLVSAEPELGVLKAKLHAANDELDKATSLYRKLFVAGYDVEDELLNYLNLAVKQEEYKQAIRTTELFLWRSPSPRVKRWLSSLHSQNGDPNTAIQLLVELHEEDSNDYETAYSLADTYFGAERFQECLDTCTQLIDQNKKTIEVYLLKGASEYALEWHVKAQTSFREVLKLDSNNADAKQYLQYISAFLGKGDRTQLLTPVEAVPLPQEVKELIRTTSTNPDTSETNEDSYGAVELYRITGLSYEKDNHKKTTTYRKIKVTSSTGVNNYSTLKVSFDPLTERVFVNELSVYDDSGKLVAEGSKEDYYVLDDSNSDMATQDRVVYIPIPNLKKGSTLELTYTKENRSEPSEFGFHEQYLTSIVPMKLGAVFFRGDHSQLLHGASKAETNTVNSSLVVWHTKNPPVFQFEPLQRPLEFFLSTILILDRGTSWEPLAEEYLEEIAPKLILDDDTREKAVKLTQGVQEKMKKIALLSSYVQKECNYKAIEFGLRSRIPNTALETMRNGYGDCKDHSVWLTQLLRAVDIPANLVLIKSGGPLAKNFPTLEQFDHMIVHIPQATVDGKDIFVDCTSKNTSPYLPITSSLNGKLALVLDPQKPRFVRTPDFLNEGAAIEVKRVFSPPAELSSRMVDLLVNEKLILNPYCAAGVRGYLREYAPKNRRKAFSSLLNQMTRVRVQKLKIENLESPEKDLVLTYSYKIPDALHRFSKSTDDLRLVGSVPSVIEDYFLNYESEEERVTPFELAVPLSIDSSTKIRVSSPLQLRGMDLTKTSQEKRKFLEWSTETDLKGNDFVIRSKIRRFRGKYQPEEFSEFIQVCKESLSALKRPLEFSSSNP